MNDDFTDDFEKPIKEDELKQIIDRLDNEKMGCDLFTYERGMSDGFEAAKTLSFENFRKINRLEPLYGYTYDFDFEYMKDLGPIQSRDYVAELDSIFKGFRSKIESIEAWDDSFDRLQYCSGWLSGIETVWEQVKNGLTHMCFGHRGKVAEY